MVLGGGPIGLRAAIELTLCGVSVHLVESRDAFVRLNVLHLWEWVEADLVELGLKVTLTLALTLTLTLTETQASLVRREWRLGVARALREWEAEKGARAAAENDALRRAHNDARARAAEPRAAFGGVALQRSNSLPRSGVRARAATPRLTPRHATPPLHATPRLGTPPRSAALRDSPERSPPRSPPRSSPRSPTRSPAPPLSPNKQRRQAAGGGRGAPREERWDGTPLMFRLTVAGWCKPRDAGLEP